MFISQNLWLSCCDSFVSEFGSVAGIEVDIPEKLALGLETCTQMPLTVVGTPANTRLDVLVETTMKRC